MGDLPDDIRMGRQAKQKMNLKCWGLTSCTVSPRKAIRALREAGVDRIIENPNRFEKALGL